MHFISLREFHIWYITISTLIWFSVRASLSPDTETHTHIRLGELINWRKQICLDHMLQQLSRSVWVLSAHNVGWCHVTWIHNTAMCSSTLMIFELKQKSQHYWIITKMNVKTPAPFSPTEDSVLVLCSVDVLRSDLYQSYGSLVHINTLTPSNPVDNPMRQE